MANLLQKDSATCPQIFGYPSTAEAPNYHKEAKMGDRILKKLSSACKTLKGVASVIKTACSVTKLLKAIELVPRPMLAVLPFAVLLTTITGVLPSSTVEVIKSANRVRTFTNLSKKLHDCKSVEEKIHVLEQNLDAMDGMHDSFEGDLKLSENACNTIQERIDRVRRLRFSAGNITADEKKVVAVMENAVDVLKGRARVILAYDCLDFVTNIVEIASEVLFLTPLVGIAAGLGLASLASSVGAPLAKSFFVNPNPFDSTSKSKALDLVEKAKDGLKHAREFLSRKVLHRSPQKAALPVCS